MLITRSLRVSLLISISSLLFLAVSVSVHARVGVGLTGLTTDEQAASQLAAQLEAPLQETVVVRSFDNPATLYTWLTRFREVDVALLPKVQGQKAPAGSTHHLLDIHPQNKAAGVFMATVRAETSSAQRARLKKALLALSKTPQGSKALHELGILAIVPPGAPAPSATVAKPAQQVAQSPQKTAKIAPKPQATTKVTRKTEAPSVAVEPALATPVVPPKLSAKPVEPVEYPPTRQPLPAPQAIKKRPVTTAVQPTTKQTDPPAAPEANPSTETTTPAQSKDPATTRLYIFLLLLLSAAILVKAVLIFKRLQPKKKTRPQPDTPAFSQSLTAPPLEAPTDTAPADMKKESKLPSGHEMRQERLLDSTRQLDVAPEPPPRIIDQGVLAEARVPALLKRCAASTEPVQLHTVRATGEKRLSFSNGKLNTISIWNNSNNADQAGCQQLLYLLSRDDLISTADRDLVAADLDEGMEPNVVSALLNRNLIDPAILTNVLEWQVKAAVFSLILFPEGTYQITPVPQQTPLAKSVSIDVSTLIPEAAHHRAEWTAIRRALPTLDTRLQFQAEGRKKLEQVGLSVQQQLLLSQVDGQRSVGDLCRESIMIDYEIYRFLYMMLKAGVLQHVDIAS